VDTWGGPTPNAWRNTTRGRRLVAIAGGTRAPTLASDYGVDDEPSVEALVSRADISAVIITSPQSAHCAKSVAEAQHSKPVLVEKPMAISSAECRQMIDACRDAGVALSVIKPWHYRGATRGLHERITRGDIGEVRMISLWWLYARVPFVGKEWFRDPKEGGFFLDAGSHCFDYLRWIAGAEPVGLYAQVANYNHNGETPRSTMTTLTFANGVMASLWLSYEVPAPGWPRFLTATHPIHFASDATGFGRFQRYLDRHSLNPRDFLIPLEPTGSYGLTVLLYLLSKGYRVLQVENRAVKDYREKMFGSETKTNDTDARLMARMGFLHELVGEEFSIQPVLLMNPDAAALRGMVHDLAKLQKEITRRRNQLQQMAALTFPELKTFFKGSTAAPAARALLEHFATPQDLAAASTEHVAEVLRSAHAYSHATRAAELQALAQATAGVPTLTHHQWREAWLITQLSVVERARQELVDEVALASATHPYTRIIESLLPEPLAHGQLHHYATPTTQLSRSLTWSLR
jgi:predicted dehydrogenase